MRKKHPKKKDKSHPSLLVKKDAIFLIIVVGITLCLNAVGFGWGMDGYVPWAPDAIEGITTVREMPKLFGQWTYKYPRLQFLIDGLCYKPFLQHWEKNKVYVQGSGPSRGYALTPARLNTLATVSRINILVMSSLIVIFVYLIAKFYYADSIAAFTASLAVSLTFVFVYYSHTTCVDIPSMLWITAGVYFLVRSVVHNRLRDHIAMAVMFAFAACTKDPMLVYAAAFALAYLVLRFQRVHAEGRTIKNSLLSLVNQKTLLALAMFCLLFALIQNIIPFPKAYWERMGVWVGGRGVEDFNKGFTGQLDLLASTLRKFYWAIGWPLLLLFFVSFIATSKKHLLFNLMVIVFPLAFFYVMVTMRIKMSYIRYYLPVMGLLFLPMGCFVSRLFDRRSETYARFALAGVMLAGVLSAAYCVALDVEFIRDSRTQAARWFAREVPAKTQVLSCIRRPYGPKLEKYGYPMIENWKVPPLETLLAHQDQLPDYVVVSSSWLNLQTREAQDFRTALLNKKTAYLPATSFHSCNSLNPHKSIWAMACWPVRESGNFSPDIYVLKKGPAD